MQKEVKRVQDLPQSEVLMRILKEEEVEMVSLRRQRRAVYDRAVQNDE